MIDGLEREFVKKTLTFLQGGAGMTQDRFSREIETRGASWPRRAGPGRRSWRYAALLGAGGWLLVVPVVGGAYLGRWLDARHVGGGQSWTLTLILLGLGAGDLQLLDLLPAGVGAMRPI